MRNLWWYAVKQALVKKLFMTLSMRIWRWKRCVYSVSRPDAATQTESTFFVKFQPYTIKDNEDFFARLVTDSKSWLHYHTLDNKRWSVQWEHAGSSHSFIHSFTHSFLWHVQNAMIPCCSQELLPFLSVMYFFLPPFSTNNSSVLSHLILPSISWSTSQSCCSQIHI